ncbi:MAG TPA: RNA-binding domain-containing protein [Terriglobales bacterium]|jgi:predicted HTH transcriptional regulator|nr:RNA-binding domain-containing protein [Terriglobales bacterium]
MGRPSAQIRTPERQTLDYKVQLPGGGDDDKREFLGDVTSFANMSGGDLLFGISDERYASGRSTGLPGAAEGLVNANLSAEIGRLENLVA